MDAFLLSNASTLAFIRFVLWHRSRCRPHNHLQRPAGTSCRPHHPAPHKTRLAPTCRASTTSPDRAVVILPGLGNNAADYAPLAATLQAIHGLHVEAAPVTRLDWARNASGLLDPAYYTGKLKPRPTVDWYLERVEAAINAARTALPGAPVTLLAHSAGGWLGRLFMLEYGTSSLGIDRFVSLGSPHQPPPEGVIDQTRGILTTISAVCPGAFHDEVKYITVAGKYIRGAPLLGPGPWPSRIVGAGYKQVCGDAEAWGDGVVPVPSAHLEGALQLTVDGVYHSPLGAEDGSAAADAGREISAVAAAMHAAGKEDDNVDDTNDKLEEEGLEDVKRARNVYDSDDYEASPADVEEAAAVGVKTMGSRSKRLWYGSHGVLERWVGLLGDENGWEQNAGARVRSRNVGS